MFCFDTRNKMRHPELSAESVGVCTERLQTVILPQMMCTVVTMERRPIASHCLPHMLSPINSQMGMLCPLAVYHRQPVYTRAGCYTAQL